MSRGRMNYSLRTMPPAGVLTKSWEGVVSGFKNVFGKDGILAILKIFSTAAGATIRRNHMVH